MRTINRLILGGCSILLCTFFACQNDQDQQFMPLPGEGTQVKWDMEDMPGKSSKKAAALEAMHRSAPDVDWRTVEYSNQMEAQAYRIENQLADRGDEEFLADGALIGTWYERGSSNQSGSIRATTYDVSSNLIYCISDGGTLWSGALDGSEWKVVNQTIAFDNGLLSLIDMPDDGKRMLTMINKIVHYSDDLGLTWTAANGLNTYDNWGSKYSPAVIHKNGKTFVYLLVQEWDDISWSSSMGIYYSEDAGESFTKAIDFDDDTKGNYSLNNPHNSDRLFLMMDSDSRNFFEIDVEAPELTLLNTNNDIELNHYRGGDLKGAFDGTDFIFYVYSRDGASGSYEYNLYQSKDFGATWNLQGLLPKRPWGVGIYVSPSKPERIYLGEVEMYRSWNAGTGWAMVNGWGDYYSDVENKLHADMMYFTEHIDQEGDEFLLIANHGGLSESRSFGFTTKNLGLEGLNVSQYYSVRTDPNDPNFVYAGTQDQGFQRGSIISDEEASPFDQVISGDYGHISFSEDGQRLWTVYPGGWVTYYHEPQTNYYTATYEIDSDNESVWIPPLIESRNTQNNEIYMAGGNINGGPGSHIIKLTAENESSIVAEQNDFDFYAQGGLIGSFAISPLNTQHWYVATDNGLFFTSKDEGLSWTNHYVNVPGSHYLYGSSIYPSHIDTNTIYMAGSGYSNAPVLKSVDGGESFTTMREGMPATLVFQIVANEDESRFFAATEAGPYVFITEEDRWYPMYGLAAPVTRYWSVEYVPEIQTARFGTYGRGIWDFKLSETTPTEDLFGAYHFLFEIYPNPATDALYIKSENENMAKYQIFDINGKKLIHGDVDSKAIDLSQLSAGTYVINVSSDGHYSSKKFIIQK